MKLTYSCAIVSFCPDLTSPAVPSLPVGVLLVGQVGEHGLASVLVPNLIGPRLDDITREVLMSVPDLLRLHVDEVLAEDVSLPAAQILRRLHEKLRNTLFVSEILDEKSTEVDEPVQTRVTNLLLEEYKTAVERQGWELEYFAADQPHDQSSRASERIDRIGVGDIPDASSTFRFRSATRSTLVPRHA